MKKQITILLASALLFVVLVAPIEAQGIEAWVHLNKTHYEPGEQGTITIVIRNNYEDDPIDVKNVTVHFTSWMRYGEDGWDPLGNQTIVYDPPIIISSDTAVALDQISFTVPDDDRGHWTPVSLSIFTSKGLLSEHNIKGWAGSINVVDAYNLRSLRAMDNIVLLLSVGAILAIIGAIIIAAAVFLSGRRPGVTWQKEQ